MTSSKQSPGIATRLKSAFGALRLRMAFVSARAERCVCHGSHVAFFLSLALLSWSGAPAHANTTEYLLGPQDRIRVLVYEWRASKDEFFEWTALNDEFTISAEGSLSLPLIGEVRASGMGTSALAQAIASRLQNEMGLGRRPVIAVEVVKFRPFYIVGDVQTPGEYPFRPGLTVYQALSLAGGLQRLTERALLRFEREAIATRGELNVFDIQTASLTARRARLQAEFDRAETISFPAEWKAKQDDPSTAIFMQQEQQIFDARRDAFTTQMNALEHLKSYLDKEIESLNAQIGTEDTQMRLLKKELQSVSSLVEKGLAVTPRQLSLERTMAQIEGDRLRLGTNLLRARQEISKTDIAIIELRNKRNNEITVELREAQAKLEELARRSDTAEQLLYETVATQSRAERARGLTTQPTYTIRRPEGGQVVHLNATESTPLQPGDTVQVEVPLPRSRYSPLSLERGNSPTIGVDSRVSRAREPQAESR
jgi:polysaccharide export outer membrane protein/exopolysaccharide production protein ExoF